MASMMITEVSVVIPTYNRWPVVRRAVESALKQTVRPKEVIVVDDGSSDGTAAGIRQMATEDPGAPIRLVQHEGNRGGAAARNTGVAAATGSHIAFLDSDDAWSPTKLEAQLAALTAAPLPHRTVVYCRVRSRQRRREVQLPASGIEAGMNVGDYLFLAGGLMQSSTLLIPRRLALAARIDADLRRHQDIFLCMELERLGASFVFVPEALTEWCTQTDFERVSTGPSDAASLVWLTRYGDRLTAAARTSFQLRVLAPLVGQSGRRMEATGLILTGRRNAEVGGIETMALLARAWTPWTWQQMVRRTFHHSRGQ